jgi:Arm DNA-binding domain
MAIHKLSAARIAKLTTNGMYGDGGNLWLCVSGNGRAKSWVFRWTERGTGRERNIGLGPLHTVDLARARDLAKANRLLLLEGKDPKEHRDAERLDAAIAAGRAKTVKQVTDEYWDAMIAGTSLAYRRSTHIELRDYVYNKIGHLPIQKVDRAVILEDTGIKKDWTTKNPTAKRARFHLGRIFEFAITHHYYHGENPAAWKHLKHVLRSPNKVHKVKHFASLSSYKEIGELMQKLRAHRFKVASGGNVKPKDHGVSHRVLMFLEDGQSRTVNEVQDGAQLTRRHGAYSILSKLVKAEFVERDRRGLYRRSAAKSMDEYLAGRHAHESEHLGPEYRPNIGLCVEFVILTGVRGQEARLAQWKEINLADMLWVIPPEHHKTGYLDDKPHIVPITKPMLTVLEEMQSRRKDQPPEALIFPGPSRRGVINGPYLARYLRESIQTETTMHGCRSSLRDFVRDKGYANDLWEIQVGHKLGDRTSQSYGHDPLLDTRRRMMEEWGEFCSRPEPEPQSADNVIPIPLADRRLA